MPALAPRHPTRQPQPRQHRRARRIRTLRRSLHYRSTPLILGILNVTPDSFSDAGRYVGVQAAVAHGRRMVLEGADAIDIGGESTRPGSAPVPLEEELRRVIPVVERLARKVEVPLSIDTSKARVAEAALRAGAAIINDVTALRGDPHMAEVIRRRRASVILMHMRSTPLTMQRSPRYHDVVEEVLGFLREAIRRAHAAGIDRRRILIDPGFGFGKTVRHNLVLMASLSRFAALGVPVVVGASRKSFIGRVLEAQVEDRLAGSLACVGIAQEAGVEIVRVHDVKATAQYLRMRDAIRRQY